MQRLWGKNMLYVYKEQLGGNMPKVQCELKTRDSKRWCHRDETPLEDFEQQMTGSG